MDMKARSIYKGEKGEGLAGQSSYRKKSLAQLTLTLTLTLHSTLLVVMEEKEQAFPKVGEAVDRLANSSPTNHLFLALKHKR